MKNPHVTILQTSFAKRDDTIVFLKEKVPGVKVEFITDSTILADVRANGGPTKAVYDRMKLYAKAAEISGADLIVNSCSTVGEVADEYRKEVSIPVMKIEDPMCQWWRSAARKPSASCSCRTLHGTRWSPVIRRSTTGSSWRTSASWMKKGTMPSS